MRGIRTWQIAGAALLLVVVATTPAHTQGRGWGRNQQAQVHWDPENIVTMTGTVQEVVLQAGTAGAAGVHVLLDVDGESKEAHLGPTLYLIPNGMEIEVGDRLTVFGSDTVVDGQPAVVASEVRKGEFSLTLRNDAGFPQWAGQGPRAVQGGRGRGGGNAQVSGRGYGRGNAQASGRGFGRGYGRGWRRGG